MSTSLAADDLEPPPFSRPTWAEIDLNALRWNVRELRRVAGADTGILAVIEANAYGHGVVPVARVLLESDLFPSDLSSAPACGVQMLCVASVDEGLQLRESGIDAPILLLSAILPDEARAAVRAQLTPTVFTREMAAALDSAASAEGRVAEAHLKIDTGMGRVGVWHSEAVAFYRSLREFPHLRISGIYTHFACADEPDDMMTPAQLQVFESSLRECGISSMGCTGYSNADSPSVVVHASNSAAMLRYPEAKFDMVRPGLALYGVLPPVPMRASTVSLWPVMTLKARVTNVKSVPAGTTISYGATWRASRESCIATVPVGYADGYPRCLSNRARVLIRDACCPVVGRVTMDQILVDCTHLAANLCVGESVTLFGNGLPVEDVAAWAETIP